MPKDPLRRVAQRPISKKPRKSVLHTKKHTYPMAILWADALSDFRKIAQGTLNAWYDLAHSLFQVLAFLKNETEHITESLRKQLLFYLSRIFGAIAPRYTKPADREITFRLQREVIGAIDSPDVLYYLPEACHTAHDIKHQENTQRIKGIGKVLSALTPVVGRLDSRDETDLTCLEGLHTADHLASLGNMPKHKNVFGAALGKIDMNGQSILYHNVHMGDIKYTKNTPKAIMATLGAARDAVNRTLGNLNKNGREGEKLFLVVRPPSHHAHHEHPEGFCFASTLVYAAKTLITQNKKVLIVDFDVHHGNGTYQQLKFLHNNRLKGNYHFIDVFTKESYIRDVPNQPDLGYQTNMNFYPMKKGYSGADLLNRIQQGIVAMNRRGFSPDVILVSAGFDSVAEDNYGGKLVPQDYAAIGALLASTCPHMVSFLEGGYNLSKLPESVEHYILGTGGLANQPEPAQVQEALTFLFNRVSPAISKADAALANEILRNKC